MKLAAWLAGFATGIKRDAMTLWFARTHRATPWYAKVMGALVLGYALSPIDLIPDFIPVLGYVDDLVLLPLLMWTTLKLLPPEVVVDSREKADRWIAEKHIRPRSIVGAAVIVCVWVGLTILTIAWAVRAFGS